MDIPRQKGNKGHADTLREMKSGNVRFLSTSAQSVTATIHRLGMQGKFTVRSVDGGVNVWRIK